MYLYVSFVFLACMQLFVCVNICLLLFVTWEESLNLMDDGLVAGIPLSPAHLAPVSNKLLYGGLQLVHVKRGGWAHFLRILLDIE